MKPQKTQSKNQKYTKCHSSMNTCISMLRITRQTDALNTKRIHPRRCHVLMALSFMLTLSGVCAHAHLVDLVRLRR